MSSRKADITPAAPRASPIFSVEGERRYWVHVAIDRSTGQIIDENIEPVKRMKPSLILSVGIWSAFMTIGLADPADTRQ